MRHVMLTFALLSVLLVPSVAASQNAKEEAQRNANRDFLGIRFGVGFGMTSQLGGNERIDEAELVDGVVRVKKTLNHRPRVLFETHYFWQLDAETITTDAGTIEEADIGIGPFAAIQGSSEEVLEAFGIGMMVGFKRDEGSSFNIGIGIMLDPTVRVLGDGVQPNEPLPNGESEIRFKEEPRWGVLTLVSFSF